MTEQRVGVLAGFSAYALWGIFPLVFRLLDDVSPVEILFHRIAWSLVVVLAVLVVQRRFRELVVLVRHRRSLQRLALAAVFISVNWLTYIWAVNSGHVVDAALGYYVNPLFTVALGVIVLHERLRPAQKVALGFGVASVLVLSVANGRVPWIALVLAGSFGMYGYLKKDADAKALTSLAIETAVLAPVALVGLSVFAAGGELSFTNGSAWRDLLLAGLGVVTAVPLLLFATAATRIPLSMLGLLQYVTPTMQLICGVVILDEDLPPARLAGFALVWIALTVLATDAVRSERRSRRLAVEPV
ncbi:MAG: EamA family transporter RarD [Acidimicrobiia bacterium]